MNIGELKIVFNISDDNENLIKLIEEKLSLINFLNLSKKKVISLRARVIHSSLAIEDNSLSLDSVEDIIYNRIVFGSNKEIEEVKNINELYQFIDKFNWINEDDFICAYVMLMKTFNEDNYFYRNHGEGVKDGERIIYVAPDSLIVPALMKSLFEFLNDSKDKIHPLILASLFHYYFVYIHPFSDGNGRMARFWVHLILSSWNSKFKNIPIEEEIYLNQEKYYDSISECHNNGNANKFIEFMLDIINSVLDKTTQKTTQKVRLNSNQEKIVEYIRNNPNITRCKLANKLNITSDGVKYNLKKLCDNNVIERIGPVNGGYWKVRE